MIGLAERGRATLGVITAPAWGRAFLGVVGDGAWEVADDGKRTPIHVSARETTEGASIVVSRSRSTPQTAAVAAAMGALPPVALGSSGLKAVVVATGDRDVYLQAGRAGMRWDACSSDALVRAAGGLYTDASGALLDYRAHDLTNRTGLLATNGHLHPRVVRALSA